MYHPWMPPIRGLGKNTGLIYIPLFAGSCIKQLFYYWWAQSHKPENSVSCWSLLWPTPFSLGMLFSIFAWFRAQCGSISKRCHRQLQSPLELWETAHFPHCCNLLQVLAWTVPDSDWHPNVWGLKIYNWYLKEPPKLLGKKKVERLSCKPWYLSILGNLEC